MLEFYDGQKKVECRAIYERGVVGQVVILTNVGFRADSTYPLAAYPQPYAFTITGKVDGVDGHYVLRDKEGNEVTIHEEHSRSGASCGYLYDANEWLDWCKRRDAAMKAIAAREKRDLELQLKLLTGILERQGLRIVTESEAKVLGIKN